MTEPTIRPLTAADVPSIADWMPTIEPWTRYGLTADRTRERLENALSRGDIVLAADLGDGQAVGVAWCIPDGAFDFSPYLRWLAMRPDLSGRGIGAALLASVEAAAAVYRPDLFLLAADFNIGAHRFYTRHGYIKTGVLPDYVVSGVAEWLYWKRL